MKKRLAEKNFAGNDNGNVYELDVGEDFVASMFSRTEWDGFSSISNKADLSLANSQIAAASYASVVDEDAFIRLWAMEIMLKHWDGYAKNRNNTYLYNDVTNPVATPTVADVNFKFVPSGIDQILQGGSYTIYNDSILAASFAANSAYKSRLRAGSLPCQQRLQLLRAQQQNGAVHQQCREHREYPANPARGGQQRKRCGDRCAARQPARRHEHAVRVQLQPGRGGFTVIKTDRTGSWHHPKRFYTTLSSTGALTTPIFGACAFR
jgi:hypothetical protein